MTSHLKEQQQDDECHCWTKSKESNFYKSRYTEKKRRKKNSSITTINLDNEVSLVKQVNALTIHLAIK